MTGRINILFLCTGNICRSPMAEFIMKKLISDSGAGPEFVISSAACTSEETGNDIYPPAKRKLKEKGIPFTFHAARRVTKKDMDIADYVVVMDGRNTRRLFSDFGNSYAEKTYRILEFAGEDTDVSDPWYTGDFETAYTEIERGCRALLRKCLKD